MAAFVDDFWATLGKDFTRLESSLDAEIWVSALSLHYLSIVGEKKKCHFGVNFSFNELALIIIIIIIIIIINIIIIIIIIRIFYYLFINH